MEKQAGVDFRCHHTQKHQPSYQVLRVDPDEQHLRQTVGWKVTHRSRRHSGRKRGRRTGNNSITYRRIEVCLLVVDHFYCRPDDDSISESSEEVSSQPSVNESVVHLSLSTSTAGLTTMASQSPLLRSHPSHQPMSRSIVSHVPWLDYPSPRIEAESFSEPR